jgi:hypothetical protein
MISLKPNKKDLIGETIAMIKGKIGDDVMIECLTSMGTGGIEKITDITTKYDENTGKPYKFIWCKDRAFHSVTGAALNPPTFYYICDIN